jgi:cytochrome bd ubiquinol oxidase subunit II
MSEVWFGIAALMVTTYVVLDGFDFGAGALHLFVARTDRERREVLSAIGPYWDGNEVWLLASGGVLFLAFPKVLASGLSGFYFAIFLVLWALILRGLAIEFRSHVEHPLWRAALDAGFAVASIAMPVLLGAALGNLLRGVPLDENGWFSLGLFTDFTTSGAVGILDWYTVLVGVFAAIAIAMHGAMFLLWKTAGAIHDRLRTVAMPLALTTLVLWPVLTAATAVVNRAMYEGLANRLLAWVALLLAMGGAVTLLIGLRRGRPILPFLGSSAFLAGLLAATAALVFPVMLRSTTSEALSLTAYNSSVPAASLRTALGWWVVALPLAVSYFVWIFRIHRGKVSVESSGH